MSDIEELIEIYENRKYEAEMKKRFNYSFFKISYQGILTP